MGRTNREGALLHYFCIRGSYYSGGRANRGGRSNRGSTVYDTMVFLAWFFWIKLCLNW